VTMTHDEFTQRTSQGGTELVAEGITVRFGGVVALEGVGLRVRAGEFVGLMGPNGAGKSTLFNVMCGVRRPALGHVIMDGVDVSSWTAARRARFGLVRTYQHLSTFGSLSVKENLLVAREAGRPLGIARGRKHGQDAAAVAEVLAMLQIEHLADRLAGNLPTGQSRLVEIARSLCTHPRFLLLDEPIAGLSSEDSDRLVGVLKKVHAEAGGSLGIVVVEHHVDVLIELCNEITVLDFGRVIASGPPNEVRNNPAVVEAYLGGEGDLG
jgi:branched-chain amino acid transport system ATP-binding protein